MEELKNEVKLQFIEQEIQIWNNTLYMYSIRHRVNKKLGNEEACKSLEADLVKAELALDELKQIRRELTQEPIVKTLP